MRFQTDEGLILSAVTAEQMREVDRIAEEEFGLQVLQMMENAGRNLALHVMELEGGEYGEVAVLVGGGGNGGGGLCCARHLHNRGFKVSVLLDRDAEALGGPAERQLRVLRAAGVLPDDVTAAPTILPRARVVVDALIGYGLKEAPRGAARDLIEATEMADPAAQIVSLDIPSGVNATTGETPGAAVRPDRTVTLAAPKTGLFQGTGELYLADIGIPPEVFHRAGVDFEPIFAAEYWVSLRVVDS